MIEKRTVLPALPQDAAAVRMGVALGCYPDETLCYVQPESGATAVLSAGHLTVFAATPADAEWRAFLNFLPARDLFASGETFRALGLVPDRVFSEFARTATQTDVPESDEIGSREIFELFRRAGLYVPEYGDFAVDFCRKRNHGFAAAYVCKGKSAAVCQFVGKTALLTGVAAVEKGYGSVALKGILNTQTGRSVHACSTAENAPFYEKNGFSVVGTVGESEKRNGFFQVG